MQKRYTSWGSGSTRALGGAGVCWGARAGVVCGFGCWETMRKERKSRKSWKKMEIWGDWLFNLVYFMEMSFLIKMNKKLKKLVDEVLKIN